jgi:23S rRNA (adenine2503-C2)-methyltransferase
LLAQFRDWGQPSYRAAQLLEWLYVHRVTHWEEMSNLPKALLARLRAQYDLKTLELIRKQGSRDSTEKFLWRLVDQSLIESVLIPANPTLYGEPSDRRTLCISTQVGCAYGCRFCASGLQGWKRNLEANEIVEQVIAVERWNATQSGTNGPTDESRCPRQEVGVLSMPPGGPGPVLQSDQDATGQRLISNLVIMGMGEPLANYDNLLKALKILNAPWGRGIGARKITISTSGLAPQIRKLADEPLQFRLAISLHGATDTIRSKIMPVNRKYPLRELTAACEYYQKQRGRMITFEYILIEGLNDSLDQIEPLAALARRLNAKVNLIPYNDVEGLPWKRPQQQVQESFLNALESSGVHATLRREKGHDIDAACGQLRLKTERELANR